MPGKKEDQEIKIKYSWEIPFLKDIYKMLDRNTERDAKKNLILEKLIDINKTEKPDEEKYRKIAKFNRGIVRERIKNDKGLDKDRLKKYFPEVAKEIK